MTESTVPQDVLDGLAAEAQKMGGAPQPVTQPNEPEEIDEQPDEPEQPEGDDLPADFKSYEQYVADGGDPDYYRGPKAYKQQKEIIDELKGVKDKFKRLDDETLKLQQLHDREKQRLLKQLEDEKKKAREDLDFDAYDKLEEQRRELEDGPKPEAGQNQEPEVIANYRSENPQLNPADPGFDPVYASAFAGAFNQVIAQAQQRAGRALTDGEIKTHLETVQQRLGGQAQQRRTSKVEGARRPNKKEAPTDKMPSEIKSMYDRWSNHADPKKRKYAESLAKQYGA